jgi:hypothetical protein
VLHCPYCHGWEVRDQRLGVLGDGSPTSVRYTQIVRQWTKDLIVFVPAASLTAAQREGLTARGISIAEAGVNRIVVKDGHLAGVELDDGRLVHRDAVFVPPRFVPNKGVLTALGCDVTDDGWVITGPDGPHQRSGRVGGRQRGQPAGAGHHRRWRGINRRHRDQRRPHRRRHPRRYQRPGPGDGAVTSASTPPPGPPTKHQLALMIWIAVFPTLTVLNLALGRWLKTLAAVPRTFILATVAVPIVIYGLMPQLHRLRAWLLAYAGRH